VTLTFTARALRGSPKGALREFGRRADRVSSHRFGAASLFIDPSGQEVQLQLTHKGIPGNDIFQLSLGDAVIDTGPGATVPLTVGTDAPSRSSPSSPWSSAAPGPALRTRPCSSS
jgi:hypothetical protein